MTEERSLEDRMLANLVSHQAAVRPRAVSRRRPISMKSRIVAMTGVVVAIVVAVISSSFMSPAPSPTLQMAAAHSAEAVRNEKSHTLLKVTEYFPAGETKSRDTWTDGSDPSFLLEIDYGQDGNVLSESGARTVGENRETVLVDHRARTTSHALVPSTEDSSSGDGTTPAGGTLTPRVGAFTPYGIAEAYEQKVLTVKGEEVVDGVQRIRVDEAIPNDGNHFAKSRTWWIDMNTYLPVKMTMDTIIVGPDSKVTFDYEWIDRTPENLAKLWPSVPQEYQEK